MIMSRVVAPSRVLLLLLCALLLPSCFLVPVAEAGGGKLGRTRMPLQSLQNGGVVRVEERRAAHDVVGALLRAEEEELEAGKQDADDAEKGDSTVKGEEEEEETSAEVSMTNME